MSTDVTPGRVVSVVFNDEENLDALDRDRANALLERGRRFPMPKCGAFSPRSAIPYTAAVSA
jgi:hypothetical protein